MGSAECRKNITHTIVRRTACTGPPCEVGHTHTQTNTHASTHTHTHRQTHTQVHTHTEYGAENSHEFCLIFWFSILICLRIKSFFFGIYAIITQFGVN